MLNWKRASAAGAITLVALGSSVAAFAESKASIDVNVHDSLHTFYAKNPTNKELALRSAGMLVFPRITKGGAGIAGEYGEGVLRVHGKTVDYYSIGGGSVGLTLGVAQRSEIIMFMSQEALDKFIQEKGWVIGADAGIAVVSKGAGGDYDSKTLQKPILGFVFNEKGLIGDLSLDGSKISYIDK